MHLWLKRKVATSDEPKLMLEMVTREEFLRLEGKLENMQLVTKILWDRIRALEEKMAELTVRKQSSIGAIDLSTSKKSLCNHKALSQILLVRLKGVESPYSPTTNTNRVVSTSSKNGYGVSNPCKSGM
ncbi:hypothetical protein ACH5RR_008936 [Cinchona calisaya]|uniref:Uncharacterized protein n=1 Tax=Cinchona calisaya TaxID=153742 RepID=A0ABD3AD59_9GENT